jgi:hypothetical protein
MEDSMTDVKVTETPSIDKAEQAALVSMLTSKGRAQRTGSIEAIIAGLSDYSGLVYTKVIPQAKGPSTASKSAMRYNLIANGTSPQAHARAIYDLVLGATGDSKLALQQAAFVRSDIAFDTTRQVSPFYVIAKVKA